MSDPAAEITYFWRLASNLQTALRGCGCSACADPCYDDIEGLAFTTESAQIRVRCEALLESRPVCELTREPFYDGPDIFYYSGHGAFSEQTHVLLNCCSSLA